jgi:hypothetical protein
MSFRQALRFCFQRRYLKRTVRIALVVGTILTIINQADVILSGDATTLTWGKAVLNYCVPFIVSNLGLLAGKRADVGSAASRIDGTKSGTDLSRTDSNSDELSVAESAEGERA